MKKLSSRNQENKTRSFEPGFTQNGNIGSGNSGIQDNRSSAAIQRRMQEIADNSQHTNNVMQLFPMTSKMMLDSGFYHAKGQRWQYDEAGHHVSAIKAGGEVRHFHVVREFKKGKRNELNYNEADNNIWNESVHKNQRPDVSFDEPRDIARRTAPYFGGRVS